MEDRILDEIVNQFLAEQILDENLDISKKKKLKDGKRDEVKEEIDLLIKKIYEDLVKEDNSVSVDIKTIRQNVFERLDKMIQRKKNILDGTGKINSVVASEVIKGEKNIIDRKKEEKTSTETINETSNDRKDKVKSDLVDRLKECGCSDKCIEYYRKAIEREDRRKSAFDRDVKENGEEAAIERRRQELENDENAKIDYMAFNVAEYGNEKEIHRFGKNLEQYIDENGKLREMEERHKRGECTDEELETLRRSCEAIGNGLNNNYAEFVRDKIHLFKGSIYDEVSMRVLGFYEHIHATESERAQILVDKNDVGSIALKAKKIGDSKIERIEDIELLLDSGIKTEEVTRAIDIFGDILFESESMEEFDRNLEAFYLNREETGNPVDDIKKAIISKLKAINFNGRNLEDIFESEERKEEIIDKLGEFEGKLKISDNEVEPCFNIAGENIYVQNDLPYARETKRTIESSSKEEEENDYQKDFVKVEIEDLNVVSKLVNNEIFYKIPNSNDYKKFVGKYCSEKATKGAISTINGLISDKTRDIATNDDKEKSEIDTDEIEGQ